LEAVADADAARSLAASPTGPARVGLSALRPDLAVHSREGQSRDGVRGAYGPLIDRDGEGRLMTKPFIVGDPVTVLPPYDSDPILVAMQRHATIAEIRPEPGPDGSVYMLQLVGTFPPDRKFGPFPETRLAPGWDNTMRPA
jgi:hypothetical protein